MKRGDLVLVQARVRSVAADGSWIQVEIPTPPPEHGIGRRRTNTRRLGSDGWWTKGTRVLPEAVYEDAPAVSGKQ